MVEPFNTLLDSGCTRHVVRNRALFHNYVEKSISVGTAPWMLWAMVMWSFVSLFEIDMLSLPCVAVYMFLRLQ